MKTRIAALLGDASHSHDQLLRCLECILHDQEGEYLIEDVSANNLGDMLASKPQLVIISKMNPYKDSEGVEREWLSGDLESKLIDFVKQGGSLLLWHSGLYGYKITGNFVAMLGGHFRHRPPKPLMVRYQSVADTLITQQEQSIEIMDEHFLMDCDLDEVQVFLNSVSEGGNSPAGWYREFGNGKVICITAPHPSDTPGSEQLNQIIYRCIRWCTKK
jgi:type 1 glutamine amidotransferase